MEWDPQPFCGIRKCRTEYTVKKMWTNLNLPDVNIGDEVPGHFSSLVHTTDSKPRCIMDRIRCKWKQQQQQKKTFIYYTALVLLDKV